MANGLILRTTLPLLIGFMLTMGNCATTKHSKFYTLQSISSAGASKSQVAQTEKISIGVGPIQFPNYLDRPQIVTRVGTNELRIAEYDRWAGPLEDDFASTLAENLSILLHTDRVATFPWQDSSQVNYQVTVDVLRFDGSLGDHAILTARWTIYGKDGKHALIMNKSSLDAPVKGSDYQNLVMAENETLNELSRQIASAIQTLRKDETSD